MIYGSNPVKWYERQGNQNDPLGLNAYTYRPDITAIMQSGNLYAYCINNPVMFVDPSGEIIKAVVIGAVVGAVIGGVAGARISQNNHGEVRWQYVAAGAAAGAVAGALVAVGSAKLVAASPWLLPALERGRVIEQKLGGMGNNFPVIDKYVSGANNIASSVTSIKSMDLLARSYQSGNTVYNTVMRYGNSLADFGGARSNGITVNVNSTTQRVLEIAIPTGATQSQMDQISRATTDLLQKGVEVIVRVIG